MKNFKAIRLKRGYTQNQIAQFMHTGSSTVFRWEHNITKPSLYQFVMLCRILKCTPAELTGELHNEEIPVFTADFTLVGKEPLTDELACRNCVFGIVLPQGISPRINAGDICIFSLDDKTEKESIVFCSYDNCNGQISIYKDYESAVQIIAVCQLLHSKL